MPRRVPAAAVAVLVLLAVPSAVSGEWHVSTLSQFLVWGLLIAARPLTLEGNPLRSARTGIVVGLWLAAVVSLVQVLGTPTWASEALTSFSSSLASALGRHVTSTEDARAMGFATDPNVWGVAVLVPSTIAMGVSTSWVVRLAALVPAAIVVAASGSRAAAAGLVGAVIVTAVLRRSGARGVVAWASAVLVVGIGTVLIVPGWLDRIVVSAPSRPTDENLLVASEALDDPVWWSPRVEVERMELPEAEASVWELRRAGGARTDRVQQRVLLERSVPYTFGFDFRTGDTPAVIGWNADASGPYGFEAGIAPDGTMTISSAGGVEVVSSRTMEIEEGWSRAEITVVDDGERPRRPLELGVSPGGVTGHGVTTAVVSRLQFSRGTPDAYVPTAAPDRTGMRALSAVRTRLAVFGVVLPEALRQLPFGGGYSAFDEMRANDPDSVLGRVGHEHNLFLWALLRYGLPGVAALALFFVSVARMGLVHAAAVFAVLLANLVDITLFSAGVFYPLALLASIDVQAGGA